MLLCTGWAFSVVLGLLWFFQSSYFCLRFYFLLSHLTALAADIGYSREATWNNNPKGHGPSRALAADGQE